MEFMWTIKPYKIPRPKFVYIRGKSYSYQTMANNYDYSTIRCTLSGYRKQGKDNWTNVTTKSQPDGQKKDDPKGQVLSCGQNFEEKGDKNGKRENEYHVVNMTRDIPDSGASKGVSKGENNDSEIRSLYSNEAGKTVPTLPPDTKITPM